jgi:hypothetical protein
MVAFSLHTAVQGRALEAEASLSSDSKGPFGSVEANAPPAGQGFLRDG